MGSMPECMYISSALFPSYRGLSAANLRTGDDERVIILHDEAGCRQLIVSVIVTLVDVRPDTACLRQWQTKLYLQAVKRA